MRRLSTTATVAIAAAFPVLLLLHSATIYLLPFVGNLGLLLVAGLVGGAATVLAMTQWRQRKKGVALVMAVGVLATWLFWVLGPTRELGVLTRFALERHKYEAAAAQVNAGAMPACIFTRGCESDGRTPPYLGFPFPGEWDFWHGIIFVPEKNQAPRAERLQAFEPTPARCRTKPIAPHYFVCGFQ